MRTRSAFALGIVAAATLIIFVAIVRALSQHPVVRFSVAASNADDPTRDDLPATSRSIYPQRLAYDWNLDEQFGFTYVLVPRVTGRGTISALLEGSADIALMSAAPLNQAVSDGHEVRVLAQTERSTRQVRLITDAEHVNDWYRYPVGIVPDSTLEVMLVDTLRDEGISATPRDGSFSVVESRTNLALLDLIVAGEVNTVVVFQANAYSLTSGEENEGRFVDITPSDGYLCAFYLVTTEQRWKDNREGILRAMEATAESRRMVAADPERRMREINTQEAGAIDTAGGPPEFWKVDEIVFETDYDLVRNDLTTDAELMVLNDMIPQVPDYTDALSELDDVAART